MWHKPTPSATHEDAVVALVQNGGDGVTFLRNGCYRIAVCVPEDTELEERMDFAHMSRCIVPEGRRLWLVLDCEGIQKLQKQGVSISGTGVMQDILDDDSAR